MKNQISINNFTSFLVAFSLAVFFAVAPAQEKSEESDDLRLREKFLRSVNLWPLPEHLPPLEPIRHGPREHRSYSVENVSFETLPGFFCTGNLYRPLGRKDLGPVVLSSRISHHENYQILCAHLARMGATVFSYGIAESQRAALKADSNDPLVIGLETWNAIRAIDFMTGLGRVDSNRVAVMGTPVTLALVDDRIKASVKADEDLDPLRRKTIYETLAQRLEMKPNVFVAFGDREPNELEIFPEDLKRITIEGPEVLRVPLPKDALKDRAAIAAALAKHLVGLREKQKQRSDRVLRLQDAARAEYSFKPANLKDESLIFTAPGFDHPGAAKVARGAEVGTVEILVRDHDTGEAIGCRINVVGPDGNFYEPANHDLKDFSLTGVWPKSGWGNRQGKAPVRYLGRYFYSDGKPGVVKVPAGTVRVEVWKGFEYTPRTKTIHVSEGETQKVEVILQKNAAMSGDGYWSGDPHIHIPRFDEDDEGRIFDLLEAEGIRYGSLLAYNEPAGPYSGFMKRMEAPQMRGLGKASIRSRDHTWILSGEEYRSSTYGHLNLFLVDDLILSGQEHNANDWPPFGHVARQAREAGGVSFYAHGGYAKEIYADVVQGNVDGVELLQFGVYRGIGLKDWYHMLNAGFRIPANGACDYPACRKLGDCKTYVGSEKQPNAEGWIRGMAEGRSFFTSGPMVLLEVDGIRPGGQIERKGEGPLRVKAKIRVRSEVAPVTNVQLIANGRILHELILPPSAGKGSWIEFEQEIELEESAWIAARAFSLSPTGTPDAESHTNPVYIFLNERAPFDITSVDALVAAIDGQIDFHQKREFAKRREVIAYFQRSRDILMKVRMASGAPSTGHPSDLAENDSSLMIDPGAREHSEEELEAFLKPMPPKPIEEVMQSFETVGGFTMQLVAREPLVYDPIAAAFDEWGNLYVCEMRDYPYRPQSGKPPMGSLRLLKDSDGDGVFDESHVFAEELLWSGGVAPWKGGVFVAAPPDILYLKDTDGDNRADLRETVFTGFGLKNQQSMVNNLIWGLDHKIYGSTGGNGGEIRPGDQADAPAITVGGKDFRFDPVTRNFETVTGTIQFGNTFDDWGNRFVCSQAQPLLHVVLPQRYLERNPHLAVPKAIHNLAPAPVPIFRSSPLERWRQIRSSRRVAHGVRKATDTGASHHVVDSAAGVTVYRGGAFPAEYQGNVFVADAQNNFVHRRVLTPDGVTFKSHRADPETEFVRSSDNWFRPVNFVNAPDGTLYVLDMSREIIETIHVPLDVMKFIDVKHGRQHGRIYRIAPPGFQYPGSPRLGKATADELVTYLESPHGWWRDTAHRLIYERQDRSAVSGLRQLLRKSEMPQARVHALWSLQGLGSLADSDIICALGDGHTRVREHAIRLAEPRLETAPKLMEQLLAAKDDPDPRVQFQLAFSLGNSDDPRVASALAGIARKYSGDHWIGTAVLSSVNALADRVFVDLLGDCDFFANSSGREFLQQLLGVVASRGNPEEIERVLVAMAVLKNPKNETLPLQLVGAFGKALRRGGDSLLKHGSQNPEVSEYLQNLFKNSQRIALDHQANSSKREYAIRLLGCGEFEASRPALRDLIDIAQPESIQLAAVGALSSFRDPAVGNILLEGWKGYPPAVRVAVSKALLATEARTITLLRAAEAGVVSPATIEMARRSLLLKHKNATIRELAMRLFGGDVSGTRAEVIADYRAALTLKGDTVRGNSVFQKTCMACHRIGNLGIDIGPDISSNASRDPEALLVHVLDPNRYLDPSYEVYVCIDINGQTFTGMITDQTGSSITLNKTETILRTQIKELTGTGKSLMPEGLESVITKQDMADLIAWISSKTSQPLEIGTLPGLVEPEE